METYAVYLCPRCALASPIGSDTLFGAICWAIRALWGSSELENMLRGFEETPKFVLSSAFPYLEGDGQKVRFYPRPLLPELTPEQVDRLASEEARFTPCDSLAQKKATVKVVERAKRLKTPYVSEQLFTEMVKGELDTEGLSGRLVDQGSKEEDVERVGEALITTGERRQVDPRGEHEQFWRAWDVQRNEIDRVAEATAEGRLFFSHGIFFNPQVAGLWFLVRTSDLELVKATLRYLEDTGIGGDRSVGKGHFKVEFDEESFTIPEAEIPNSWVSLSRYIPSNGECDFRARPLYYNLTTLRPKHEAKVIGLGHHTYKMLLRVLEPGSVLPLGNKRDFYGRLVPVGRNAEVGGWEVWHNGLALPAFAQIGGGT